MYIWLLYVYNRCLLCCSFLLIFYYEFYYSFYYKATENRGKQRITEDNGTITEYKEKAQKRYVSGLLKWLYYIIHEQIVYTGKTFIRFFHTISFLTCRSLSSGFLFYKTFFRSNTFRKSNPSDLRKVSDSSYVTL